MGRDVETPVSAAIKPDFGITIVFKIKFNIYIKMKLYDFETINLVRGLF
jgi:hypothetical protein